MLGFSTESTCRCVMMVARDRAANNLCDCSYLVCDILRSIAQYSLFLACKGSPLHHIHVRAVVEGPCGSRHMYFRLLYTTHMTSDVLLRTVLWL